MDRDMPDESQLFGVAKQVDSMSTDTFDLAKFKQCLKDGVLRMKISVNATELIGAAEELFRQDFRLALVAGHDDENSFRIVYLFTKGPPDQRIELNLQVDRENATVPSLSHLSFPASRFERELHDLFGVQASGHPQPRRLVLHQHWPKDWFPLRRNRGTMPEMLVASNPYPFVDVQGPGVYEIPVGPVHAGIIEPGHFRFWVVGETILKMKARLWFLHKGIEELFQGRAPSTCLELAEKISGDSAVGHGLAYCHAVEDAFNVEVCDRTKNLRSMCLELERIYNHVGDVGALCNDVGFGLANSRALAIRELLLRMNAEITGHRLLRGGLLLGGIRLRSIPSHLELDKIERKFNELVELAESNSIVIDRFSGTGVLELERARQIGVIGLVARASGHLVDARYQHPSTDESCRFTLSSKQDGDVLARFRLRCDEVYVSLGMIRKVIDDGGPFEVSELLDSFDGTNRCGDFGSQGPFSSGSGIVEGWRGTIVQRVEINAAGKIERLKVVDPSFMNWPALSVALSETIVPDFPLANKSFNLSYAGNDL